MINNKFKLGPELIFTITIVLFFVLMLVVENINGRFQTNDFRVMYDAADSFVHGKAVYGVPFGLSTGYYKYSPFTLLLFVPYTIFSFKTASILHFFIIALSAIASIILIERIISKLFFKNNNQRLLMYFLIFISVALHIIKDIHLGNTNTILIFFLILSLYLTLNNRLILSALFLTLAIFTKPYFAISILPFLLYKKYKTILFSIIFGITFLLITIIFAGLSNSIHLHVQWILSMVEHSIMLESSYTFFYLMNNYLGANIPANYSYHLFMLIGLLSYLCFWLCKRIQKENGTFIVGQSLTIFFAFLVAIIPNILITDNEHFIFTLPLITFMILYLRESKNYWMIALFIIAILMYGGNSTDIVGKELTLKIKYWGLLGIGNLLIIIMSLLSYYLIRKNREFESKATLKDVAS